MSSLCFQSMQLLSMVFLFIAISIPEVRTDFFTMCRLKNRFPFKSGHMEQYWSTLTKRWPSGRSFQSSAGRMIRVQLHQTRVTQSAGRRQERSRLAMYWMSCILASYWHLALMVLGSLCARTNGLLVSMPPSSSSWGRTNASEL